MTEVPTDAAALADALARFPSFRVLVVGDVMLDSVVRGEVRRVSPEAPAPVLLAGEERHDLGGAANVAHQLAALGATVELFGVVGADPEAAQIRDRCDSLGITATLLQDATVPTTRKIRYLAGPHHLLRVDREAVVRDTSMLEVALRDRFANGPRPDVVVLSDYGKGVVDPAVSTLVTGSASRCGVPVLLDPKTDDLVRCRGASVIKANGAEFEALTGRAIDHADVARGVEAERDRISEASGCDRFVITLGERGMVVVDGRRPARWLPAVAGPVTDVSGAGDVVIATLSLCLTAGLDLEVAAWVASVAAGLSVSQSGVAVVPLAELASALGGHLPGGVLPRAEVVGRARLWSIAGRRVVFTNGCFDLLHPGHVHLLRAAASLGDVLVVAVDTDESVSELKGAARPVTPLPARTAVLAALECVDAVVPFHHRELEALVAEVAPSCLVKGGDYQLDEVVGREVVESAGGTVELIPLLGGASTSEVIGRIAGRLPEPATPPVD